jgi:nucleotide-binding universal stress UspA family protein
MRSPGRGPRLPAVLTATARIPLTLVKLGSVEEVSATFRQVLIPVSFSVCDRHLAGYACSAARAIGGSVTFLHVLELSAQDSLPQAAQQEAAQKLLEQLSLLARRPPTCLIVPAVGTVPAEAVAFTILKVAAEIGADLIMMGLREQDRPPPDTTGLLVVPQVHCGPVLWQVLLKSRVPVQVVPCLQDRALPVYGWRGTLTPAARC